MATARPTIAGRGLGAELRARREVKKLSMRKVADELGWQSSKISRMENGQQILKREDVASLLVIYGVSGDEREHLLVQCGRTEEPGLWEGQGGLSRESRTLIQLESEATAIFNLEPLWLPGLLQTHDYTRAVMKACHVPDEDIEIRVAARMGRQAVLSRDQPPELEFAIDESALRRPVAPPQLMARQLRQVYEACDRPNVTVRVLPFSLGAHSGLDGSLQLLDLTKDKTVAYLDHGATGFFLEEDHQITAYRTVVDRLKEIALPVAESVDLIAALAKNLDEA